MVRREGKDAAALSNLLVESEVSRERLELSLAAQRAVARAAMRPSGLSAVLRFLAKHLGCWTALFDVAGTLVDLPLKRTVPPSHVPEVSAAVRKALAHGRPAGIRICFADQTGSTLQTIGQQGQLRGVLAIGTGTALDRAATDLIESVIAFASVALEQSSTLDVARRRLRSGILELLTSGAVDIAERTVEPLWGQLPKDPLRVLNITLHGTATRGKDALLAGLELLAADKRSQLFFAELREQLFAVCSESDVRAVRELLGMYGARAGLSGPVRWLELDRGMREARRAVRHATSDRPFLSFDQLSAIGLLGYLEQAGARDVALRLLEPLAGTKAGDELYTSLRVWLGHNGTWEPSAKELGIHRHTLRSRIDTAGRLLGLDLESFGARAEVWQALMLVEDTKNVRTPPQA